MDYGIHTKVTTQNINDIVRAYTDNKAYKKLFNKLNIDAYKLLYYVGETSVAHNYDLEIVTETFEKMGRKCFPKKPTESKHKKVSAIEYLNCITGILFFHDRVSFSYTSLGYALYNHLCKSHG